MANIFEKLTELQWYTILAIALLVAMGVAMRFASKRVAWNSRRLANAAMCVAIAFVLSCIRLYRMPQGGSVTPASMLPIVAFAMACGPLHGLTVGCACGLLDLLNSPYVIHPIQVILDYPLAFGALALGGVAAFLPIPEKWKLPVGVLLGGLARYAVSVLSGVVFFAASVPEGQLPILYSLGYNIAYLGPDILLCVLIACIPGMNRLTAMLKGGVASA